MEHFGDLPKPKTLEEEKDIKDNVKLTNSEWMRYRLAGQLPEEAANDLKKQFEIQHLQRTGEIHYQEIIGEHPEDINRNRKNVLNHLQRTPDILYPEYVVEPTFEEKRLIEKTIEYVNAVSVAHGGTVRVSADRIFVLSKGGTSEVTDHKLEHGFHSSTSNYIAVDRCASPLVLAKILAHEAFHLAGYKSGQINEKGTIIPSQSGISFWDKKDIKAYFHDIEESIVSDLSYKYFEEILVHDEIYVDEVQRTQDIKEWLIKYYETYTDSDDKEQAKSYIESIIFLPNNESAYAMIMQSQHTDDYKFGYVQKYFERVLKSGEVLQEREEERQKMERILEEIVQKSNGTISKSELFNDFSDAHFSGNYLPLARKIESVLGKGSFRKIANDTAWEQ